MRNTLICINLLLLAACATPREACIATANRDLTVVRALISQSEATLKRGYAIEENDSFVLVFQPCYSRGHHSRWCERAVPVTNKEAVAVDLGDEKRKLAGLRKKERQLQISSASAVKSCELSHPE